MTSHRATGRGRGAVAAGALALLASCAVIAFLVTRGDDDGTQEGDTRSGLRVTWDVAEGVPTCRYDKKAGTVTARLVADGPVPASGRVTVTVTAYADENTSLPVGSAGRTVEIDATPRSFVVTVPVLKTPHRGEDGETACRLAVTDASR